MQPFFEKIYQKLFEAIVAWTCEMNATTEGLKDLLLTVATPKEIA